VKEGRGERRGVVSMKKIMAERGDSKRRDKGDEK
jgi:hypothetical protein